MGVIRDLLDVTACARGLRRRERWDAVALLAWQMDRFRDLARFAKEHSPFYHKLYSGIDLSGPFSPDMLPVVDKTAVMDHFDEVVTDPRLRLGEIQAFLGEVDRRGCFAGEFRILSTAGTSGRRGLFALGREEWIAVIASMLRWRRLIGLRPRFGRRLRVATVGAGNALHASRLLPLGVNVGLYEFRFLSVTDPMESIVAELNDYQPDLLAPYASVAGLLALEQIEGRLSIHPGIVVTHSELLSETVVRRCGTAWGIRPFNHYGLSEMPCLGIDCAHHLGIHVFGDLCLIEPVDGSGRPVPPGEVCEKYYLTNFLYRAQPLIRYEVTDRIVLDSSDCPCGLPFSRIRTLQGRAEDTVTLPGAAGGSVRIPSLAFTLAVEDLPGVIEHQFHIDESPAVVEVWIRPSWGAPVGPLRDTVGKALAILLERFDTAGVSVRVVIRDEFPRRAEAMGKHKPSVTHHPERPF